MKTKLSVSQKRLRSLAPRALQVAAQHRGLHVSIATTATTLEPAANSFIKVYDDAIEFQAAQRREMEQGRHSLVELDKVMHAALAIVHNTVVGSEAGNLAGSVDAPEQLISDGYKVLKLMSQDGGASEGNTLEVALAAAVHQAELEWAQAQAARMALQQNQALVREHALDLNRELIALRRVLRVVVGTSHLGYQTLRVSRVSSVEVDDDDTVVEEEAIDPLTKATEAKPLTQRNGHSLATAASE